MGLGSPSEASVWYIHQTLVRHHTLLRRYEAHLRLIPRCFRIKMNE